MKTLIVEDDFTSRLLLQEILKRYGSVHLAANGKEAVEAVRAALDADDPYHLICMDIMMPEMDGHEALREIRELEEVRGVLESSAAKVIMTTALDSVRNVSDAFRELCDSYLVKPIETAPLLEQLHRFGLLHPVEQGSRS
jgi:two-component system chemotaxis response regulator CheY